MTGWILDTLLYTGLLIGLVLVLRRPAGRWFGPQFAYGLWALPFIRLLLPPIVLPVSLAPAPEGPVEALPASAAVPTNMMALDTVPPAAEPGLAVDWTEVALSVWLGGALAFLAWRVVTYRAMRRELLARARTVGEVGAIRIVETPMLAAPVAFGVRDKVIGLPPLFMAQRDIAARDLAIAHELAHHRGHDLLANFAAQALLALHWFNPLAWLGWRAMRRDQEAACDARVLAGRGRAEKALYAALIADVAAGPRLALAAPMACPVLGDKSIVHRLKSLSGTEISPRRRWLGRGLIAAGAMALPLTASVSYSAATAQVPEPPVPPAPLTAVDPSAPEAPLAPEAPEAPLAPEAPEAPEATAHVRQFVLQRESEDGKTVRRFVVRRDGEAGPLPAPGPMPQFEFHAWGDPGSPEFEARVEAFEQAMEKWGEEFGEQQAALAEGRALAAADIARRAPEVIESCDEAERRVRVTSDGRPRIVICEREIRTAALSGARSGLRSARDAVARSREMDAKVRREVLRDLDKEIARLERGED